MHRSIYQREQKREWGVVRAAFGEADDANAE
jgi:hypothetical protein